VSRGEGEDARGQSRRGGATAQASAFGRGKRTPRAGGGAPGAGRRRTRRRTLDSSRVSRLRPCIVPKTRPATEWRAARSGVRSRGNEDLTNPLAARVIFLFLLRARGLAHLAARPRSAPARRRGRCSRRRRRRRPRRARPSSRGRRRGPGSAGRDAADSPMPTRPRFRPYPRGLEDAGRRGSPPV